MVEEVACDTPCGREPGECVSCDSAIGERLTYQNNNLDVPCADCDLDNAICILCPVMQEKRQWLPRTYERIQKDIWED